MSLNNVSAPFPSSPLNTGENREKPQGFFQGRVLGLLKNMSGISGDLCKRVQETGDYLATLGKEVAVRGAEFYMDQKRKTFEAFLTKLLGSDVEVTLTDFMKTARPLIEEKVPHLIHFVEPLFALALWNYARNTFPIQASKIVAGEELALDEIVSPEKFVSSLSCSIFELIQENLIAIDELLENGGVLEEKLFQDSAQKIFVLFLPDKTGDAFNILDVTAAKAVRRFLKSFIAQGLFIAFQRLFKPAEGELRGEVPSLPHREVFDPLIVKITPLLIRSFQVEVFEKESEFLKTHAEAGEIFRPFLEKFTCKLKPFLEQKFNIFKGIKSENIECLLKAIVTKATSNLLKLSGETPPTTFFLTLVEESFKNIREREKKQKKIKEKHYKESAEFLFRSIFKDNFLIRFSLKKCPAILDNVAAYLSEMREVVGKDDLPLYRQKLRELLWDPPGLKKAYPTLQVPEKPSQEASRMLGTEKFIDQLYRLCHWVADEAISYAKNAFSIESEECNEGPLSKVIAFIKPLLRYDTSAQVRADSDEEKRKAEQVTKTHITNLIFKILVILFEKSSKNRKIEREKLLFNALELILKDFNEHIKSINRVCSQEGISQEDINKAFQPLVRDLMITLTSGTTVQIEDLLPLPKDLAKWVIEEVQREWLPPFFAKIYFDCRKGIGEISNLQIALHKIYKSDRLAQTAHLFSHYVAQFVPYFLADSAEEISKFIIDLLSPLIEYQPFEMKDFESMIKTGLLLIGKSQNHTLKKPFEFIREYVEAFLLKVFLNFSETLSSIEVDHSKQPTRFLKGSIYLEAATVFMQEAKKHFEKVNRAKEKMKKGSASQIPYKQIRAQFAAHELHPGLEEQNESVRELFYRNFTQRVLSILRLNENNGIAAPEPLKPLLWKIGSLHLFPKITEVLVNQMMAPDALHIYLKSLLTRIKDSKDGEFGAIPDDPLQRDIESSASKVIQELVGLHSTFVQTLLDYEPFRKKAGKAIGEAIRGGIEGKSLVEWIDLFIAKVLPCMHPGGWITAQAHKVYQETGELPKIDPNSNGDVFFPTSSTPLGGKVYGWNFDFPRTPGEKLKQQQSLEASRLKLKGEVDALLANMIERQGYVSAEQTAKELWKKFQTSFNRSLEKTFGESGLQLKNLMDYIFENFWKYVLEPIWRISSFPLRWVIKAIAKRYCTGQAKMRIQDVESPIHRNFMLWTLERISGLLAARASATQT